MKKILLLLILINIYLFANQSVLIINSYHKGYEFSDSIISSIEKEFYKNTTIDTNILYMDSKRITSKEYYENLSKLYSVQLKDRNYDLIIAVDRFAYDFTLHNYKSFFNNTPVLTVGIENFSKNNALNYGLKKVSALLEKRDLESNIRLIEKAFPLLENLYIINDKSLNAQHTEPLIQEVIKNHKGKYKLNYLRSDSLEQLRSKFIKKEENSAILFVRFYKNIDGHLNKNQDISAFINNSKLPVFITDSIFLKKGALGGKIIDLNSFGKDSSKMALNILYKNKYEIKEFENLEYIFDEQKVKKFLIFPSSLIKEYKLVNKSITFYDKYEGFITFVFIISPLLILLILGLVRNIILRKKIQKDLIQRVEFDSILLNAIDNPIVWENGEGIIVDSNSKFCKLIAIERKNIIAKSLDDFIDHKQVKNIKNVLNKYKENPALNHEFKYYDENKVKKVYLLKQARYSDKKTKREGVVTIFTDITKQKQIEEDKQKNRQFIIQQSKLAEIGEVFSSIAHQWKSPLVEITAIAQELFYSKKCEALREDDSFVSDIMKQVTYMTDTINDFQKFIIPSSKKINFNVYSSIESMLEIIEHNMKYNNVKIKIDVQKDACLNILGYKNEFMQSILNIINNAKDALEQNNPKDRKIDIKLFNDNQNLIILIQDNAGGIDMEFINKIFKPYYSTKVDGHGIGLYMSKMIIEDKMHGKISVENSLAGACFKIKLGHSCENISS